MAERTDPAPSRRKIDALHAHHIDTNGEDVPEDIADRIMRHLNVVNIYAGRESLVEGVQAAYNVVAVWEEFLRG